MSVGAKIDGRCLVVILLSESLFLFRATRENLIDPVTRVWPEDVEVWVDIVVLSINIFLFTFFVGAVRCRVI
jgi:hypothetical protein